MLRPILLTGLATFAMAAPVFANPFGFTTKVTCADSQGVVGFAGDDALLILNAKAMPLSLTQSGSGAKYQSADGKTVFWTKGEMALFSDKGAADVDCVMNYSNTPWVASGNEPGWQLVVENDQLTGDLQYGETQVQANLPIGTLAEGAIHYSFSDELALTVSPQICYDDMSGQIYPETVVLTTAGQELRGCGGVTLDLLSGPQWRVTEITGAPVSPDDEVTLNIFENGQVGGSTGCNSYSGAFELTGEGMSFGPMMTTRMMCGAELMAQEQNFLTALGQADRFNIGEDGLLRFYSGDTQLVTADRVKAALPVLREMRMRLEND